MKNKKEITLVVEEAARILRDYPHLKYSEAIRKAKEIIKESKRKERRYDYRENHRTLRKYVSVF